MHNWYVSFISFISPVADSVLAFDLHGRAKRARVDAAISMATDVQVEFKHAQRGIASTSKNAQDFVAQATSEVCDMIFSISLPDFKP